MNMYLDVRLFYSTQKLIRRPLVEKTIDKHVENMTLKQKYNRRLIILDTSTAQNSQLLCPEICLPCFSCICQTMNLQISFYNIIKFAHNLAPDQGTQFTGQLPIRFMDFTIYPMIYQLLTFKDGGMVKLLSCLLRGHSCIFRILSSRMH